MDYFNAHTTKTHKLEKIADFKTNRAEILKIAHDMFKPHWSKLSKVQKNMALINFIETHA